MGWSPPAVSRPVLAAVGVGYALVLAYALVVVQQLLVSVFVGVALATGYLLYRVLAAFEAIADAQQRLAEQAEE